MGDQPEKQGRPLPPVETRFKKGQSGNPGGLPRGTRHIPKLIRNEILRQCRDEPAHIPAIVAALIGVAKDEQSPKQLAAFKELRDTIDGPIVKKVEQQNTGGARIEVVRTDRRARDSEESDGE